MATPEQEPRERKKKTVWLMAGGAASLLIPLAGAVYLALEPARGGFRPQRTQRRL